MAWSDSLSKNFKLKKTEEQKKQTSDKEQKQNSQSGNFYEDFKARKANNTKENVTERLTGSASFNKNNTNKSTDRAYANKSESIVKKTSPTSTFVNNSNRFKGYRAYSERKKTGNIFVPSTVLGKYTNGFSKENTEKMKSNKWKGSYGVMPVQEKITSGDTATKEKKPGFGKWLGDNVMNGIGQFNRSVASTADLIIPTAGDFGGDSIVDRVIDYYKGDSDRLAQNAEKTNAIKGGNWGTAGKLVSGTVSALPNAIIAMMSGGTSTGAVALESTASKGIGETMLSSAKQLMKNPMYWSSFVQTAGNSYDEAKADGASDIEATATAMISSFLNAGVEVGGGIETIPSNPRSIKTWVKGMFDEGKEEVVQGIIEQATKKAVYDHNKKIVSKTDQNAIINPSRSADEFVGGAVVGGILGAGQMGAGAALDAYGHTVQTGREFKDMGEVQSVIDTGNKSDRNTSAYKYAQKMQQKQDKGVDLSDWNIGRQYQKNVKAIDAENKFINDISGATGVETEVHADMHGLNGRYISSVNNKYSPIEYDGNGNAYVRIDEDILEGVAPEDYIKTVRNVLKYKFSDGINLNGKNIAVSGKSRGEFTSSKYTKNMSASDRADKFRMAKNIDEIVNVQNNINTEGLKHPRKDDITSFDGGYATIKVGNNEFLGKILLANKQDGTQQFYDIVDLIPTKIQQPHFNAGRTNAIATDRNDGAVSTNSISENSKNVNGKIDISANGDTSIPATVKHEFTHAFKQSAPQAYQDFEDYVMKSVMETNPESVRKRLNSLKSRYEQEGIPYNDEIGRDEIVAEMTSTFEPNVNKIAYGNPNLADKILQGISTAKAKIQSVLYSPYTNDRTGVQMTYAQLNEAEQLWNNALRQAAENRENVSSGEDAVRYSTVGNKNNSLKEQIRNNLEELDRMLPVMNYTYNINQNLSNSEKRNAVLDEYLRKYGTDNKNIIVTRKGFGDVSVGAKDIRSGLRYLNTDAEYAAVLAIPSVITEGTEIDRHNNHKNRGYNTITFAAPVEINGVRGNMAVTIKETNKYKYKMHRILLPDGSMFEFLDNEKNSSYNDGAVDDNVNGSPSIATVSNNSISENKPIVKNSLGGNASDTQVKSDTDNVGTFDKNKTDIRYSFAGDNAKTADMGALQQARDLEQSGVSIEEIRKTTRWSRGLDNKWKFEIDDSGAKYNEDKIRLGKAVNLNEVIEHSNLFKAYPDLKNVKVKEIAGLEAKGIYSPEFDCIFMNKNMTTQEKLKSLIHEVQHAIQVREGFAIGESPDSENRNQSAGEIEADDVKARQGMSKEERLNIFPESMKPNSNADVVFWENGNIKNMGDVNNQTNGNSNIYDYTKSFAEQIKDKNLVRIKNKSIQTSEWTSPINAHYRMNASTNNIPNSDETVKYSMKENTDTDKVSQLYENTMQKNAYTDEFKDEAERRKPEFMYRGITNKETYEAAQTDISSRGDNTVLAELSMKNGEWSADDTAKSLALMTKYQSENNTSKAVDVASMLREKMTKAGQAVQALKIVNKLTPEGQFIDFVRQAEKAVDDQINKHPAKDKIRRELKEAENIDRQRGDSGENTQNRNDKSEKDKVLDKWKIDHLDTDDTKQVNDVLKTLDTLNDKNDLINLILKQSKERKTASNVFVKKALEGQNIEFLKDTAVMQVFGKISDKIPSSIAQKASTYQAMSHLLNARTMMRNITSNAAFNTVDRISTDIGAIADSIIGLFSGQRTVGVDRGIFEKGRFKASADRAVAQYIDIALAVNHETDSSKYNLNSARRTFKSRTLGGLERGMSYGLQVTDEWSKGGIEYNIKKSLERLKKCGFTEDEIDNIAKFEAKYRTFQDDTKLSQILKGLKDTLNVIGIGETNQVGRLKSHEFGLGDLVQKYTQVPGALITRSVEYSPLGYCKALYNIGKATYNKSKGADFNATDQRNIALSLGRAMTGTGLIALFAGLSKLGIFTSERENEDDKLKAMENSEGISNTQLNLSALSRLIASGGKDTSGRKKGDILTSLGFLEPLNTLMAMGNAVAENGSVKNPVDWANAATAKTFDQIMDMSTMSTMRSISNTLTYGGNGLDVAIGTLADSGSGFVPSPVRQFGSFIDTTQRNPYNEENSIDKARERFRTSIPGMRNNVAAKVNSFGEEKTTSSGNRVIDFLNNFCSPGYVNIYQTNDISEELYRLSEQSADVLPHIPAKSFTVDKVQYKPRGKDYEVYSKLVGTITAQKIHDIINADSYKDLSDEDKIIALSKAASDGEKEAKERYATGDKSAIQSENSVFRLTEPTTLNARKQALKESQEKQQRAVSYIQDVTDKLAEMLPDKADEYGVNSLQINDIKSIKVDGKSYDISSETEKKIVNTANEEHYSNVEKLMNNEINVEDIVGYTSKGKARTSTQADGSKVSLTGKMYNDDGTPRFDELVTVKIIYKSKENAKEHATEKYRDEIIGNNISADDEKSTKVSKSKRARTKFTSAKGSGHSSSEGKKKGRGKNSNNSGGTSRTRFTARANTNSTTDKNNSNTQDILSLPNTVNPQLIQSAVNSFMKNNNVSNTVKPIENPLFM